MAYSFILSASERPSPPKWSRTDWRIHQARAAGLYPHDRTNENISYDFTWHHNIPLKTLLESFNIAVVFCDWIVVEGLLDLFGMRLMPDLKKRIRLAREAIGPSVRTPGSGRSQLGATMPANATFEKWIARYSAGEETLLEALSSEKVLSAADSDTIMEKVAWQKWNIVEGPKESVRSDDPGSDNFDDFRQADPANVARYMAVLNLYTAMAFVEKDYKAYKMHFATEEKMKEWTLMLKGPVQGAQFLINEGLVKFNPEHWLVVYKGGKPVIKAKAVPGKEYFQVRRRQSSDVARR